MSKAGSLTTVPPFSQFNLFGTLIGMARRNASVIISAVLLLSVLLPAGSADFKRSAMEDTSRPVCRITTNLGVIDIELFDDETPETVNNFIGLATGTKEYTDPQTGRNVIDHFYDSLIFHRVIDGFMIQGGCPLGTGTGGPGYTFEDEINADSLGLDEAPAFDAQGRPSNLLGIRTQEDFSRLIVIPLTQQMGITTQEELDRRLAEVQQRISELSLKEAYELQGYRYSAARESHAPERGVIAMANSGPDTNGSQFFINLIDTPWLAGKHTVFGRVIDGMNVVDAIGEVQTDGANKPLKPVTIESIRVIKGAD